MPSQLHGLMFGRYLCVVMLLLFLRQFFMVQCMFSVCVFVLEGVFDLPGKFYTSDSSQTYCITTGVKSKHLCIGVGVWQKCIFTLLFGILAFIDSRKSRQTRNTGKERLCQHPVHLDPNRANAVVSVK